MQKPDMQSTKTFALGALIGAAAGAALALLFAPKSGREMRSDIQRQSQRLRQDTANAVTRMTPKPWRSATSRHAQEMESPPTEKAACRFGPGPPRFRDQANRRAGSRFSARRIAVN